MVRRLRLGSGLVLFSFVLTHFLNHGLGLVSLEALEGGRNAFLAFWRFLPLSLLLYGALLAHLGLAFWALYRRRRLSMPPWEAAQLVLGLAIPPLLAAHVLGTRFSYEVLGVDDSYLYILIVFFVLNPLAGIKQALVLLVVWVHGCIGLHFWLRLKPWYRRVRPIAFALALLVPTLGLLGFAVAGRDVARLAADEAWLRATMSTLSFPNSAGNALRGGIENALLLGLAVTLAVTLAARSLRRLAGRRRGLLTFLYPDGRRVPVVPGTTILEASLAAGVPHASVCGGRGRCSTCRVRIGAGLGALPDPSDEERRVLARVGAAPNVRLACQTRPNADVEVAPLLPPTASPRDAAPRPGYLQGQERELAILFADIRGFTALSENKLPYDVVFILNRYFAAMGKAVEEAGGRVDKFIGDGVMALFGIEHEIGRGCRDALSAARLMAEHLEEINAGLKHDLDSPLRIGIGIHSGPVIVGELGYGRVSSVTAIGDAVNTASRLEGLTKEFGAQLVVSAPVAEHAGVALDGFPLEEIEVRGRGGTLAVRVISDALALPARVESDVPRPSGRLRVAGVGPD